MGGENAGILRGRRYRLDGANSTGWSRWYEGRVRRIALTLSHLLLLSGHDLSPANFILLHSRQN